MADDAINLDGYGESTGSDAAGKSDRDLIQRCAEGEADAQRAIYADTSDQVYRLLLRLTGNPDDAFDIAQETYVKVFAGIHRFKGGAELATWIYAIALNEARQFMRRNKRRSDKLRFVPLSPDHADESQEDTTVMDVREALAQLPEFDRSLIVLRHFENCSYGELAEILDKPEGTIASSLNRARRSLREFFEKDSADPREESGGSGHLKEGFPTEERSALDDGTGDSER